jgi:hypothetical protein
MPKTICSVFFQPVSATRPYALVVNQPNGTPGRGFMSRFSLEAAPPDGYTTCAVPDVCYEHNYLVEGNFADTPIYADHLAPDLVQEWCDVAKANAGMGPGIFVCAGSAPTEGELKKARLKQTLWCNKLVNDAEEAWLNNKRNDIGDLHRGAAQWLGRLGFAWMQNDGQVALKDCPLCMSKINAAAAVCPNCRNTIDWARLGEHMRQQAEYEAQMKRLTEQLAAVDPKAAEAAKAAEAPEQPKPTPIAPPLAAPKPQPQMAGGRR